MISRKVSASTLFLKSGPTRRIPGTAISNGLGSLWRDYEVKLLLSSSMISGHELSAMEFYGHLRNSHISFTGTKERQPRPILPTTLEQNFPAANNVYHDRHWMSFFRCLSLLKFGSFCQIKSGGSQIGPTCYGSFSQAWWNTVWLLTFELFLNISHNGGPIERNTKLFLPQMLAREEQPNRCHINSDMDHFQVLKSRESRPRFLWKPVWESNWK